MQVELSKIKMPYEFIEYTTGELKKYIFKWLNSASLSVQNRSVVTYLSLVGANLVFFEVAIAICQVVDGVFNKYCNYEDLSATDQIRRSWCLGALFISILGGSNWVFCKSLLIPFSPWKVGIVSSATCFIYLCYKSST